MEKFKVIEPSKENPKAAVIRSVVYLGFTIIGFLITSNGGQIFALVMMLFPCLFYLLAYWQDMRGAHSLDSGSNKAIGDSAKGAAQGAAINYAKENPEQAAKMAANAV